MAATATHYASSTPPPVLDRREALARKITCKECHAPKDVGCVGVVWEARDGQWVSHTEPKTYCSKRLKLYHHTVKKFGEPR